MAQLRRIRVVEVLVDVTKRLEIVVSDLHSVVTCPVFAYQKAKAHDTRRVRIKDLPLLGAKTTLI